MVLTARKREQWESHLVEKLQTEADQKRTLENSRREQERSRLIAEEQRRTATLTGMGKSVDPARMEQIRLRADLQPLPEELIQLAGNTLSTLALQRAEVIRNYLVDKLQIPAARIVIEEVSAGGTRVELLPVPLW